MPRCIGHDLVDFGLAIAECAQTFGNGAIDDLEITAAGEFLEFDEREIRLDARRVAIHHETDGAGRGDDAHLRVAKAVALAERDRALPNGAGMIAKRSIG